MLGKASASDECIYCNYVSSQIIHPYVASYIANTIEVYTVTNNKSSY